MDDFIYITSDENLASEFLTRMHQGFPQYGCSIQTSKTATNFHPPTLRNLHFCGAILDPKTLDCRPDYSVYHGKNIVYASNLGMNFQQSISEFVKSKILFVSTLNLKKIYFKGIIHKPRGQNLVKSSLSLFVA